MRLVNAIRGQMLACALYMEGREYMEKREAFTRLMLMRYLHQSEDMEFGMHFAMRAAGRHCAPQAYEITELWLSLRRMARNILEDAIELNFANLAWANFTGIYMACGSLVPVASGEIGGITKLWVSMLLRQAEFMSGYQIPDQGLDRQMGARCWRRLFEDSASLFRALARQGMRRGGMRG